MNLLFRLFWILFRPLSVKKHAFTSITQPSWLKLRVLPTDCDVNIHLTNSRYLAFADLARMDHMRKIGTLKAALKHRLQGVVESQEITFLSAAKPFSKVNIKTQLEGWDHKYYYFTQYFYQPRTNKSGQIEQRVIAKLLLRGVFLKRGKVVDDGSWIDHLFAESKFTNVNKIQMNDELRHWAGQLDEQREQAKKASF
jgi:acyl-CoA thioesterase FadM